MYLDKEVQLFDDKQMLLVGQRIQDARKAKGISAIDLAGCIGVGKDQMSRIENGKVPCKLEYFFVLTQYLDISADFLLYGDMKNEGKEEVVSILHELNIRDLKKAKRVLEAVFE